MIELANIEHLDYLFNFLIENIAELIIHYINANQIIIFVKNTIIYITNLFS